MNNSAFIDFDTANPRRNLPLDISRKRGESNYTLAFARAFVSDRMGQGVGGRHFAVSGYGIADFVWADISADGDVPTLTAFEMKLKDWRGGLTQAYRYSYFSDRAIVVLPTDVADRAEGYLHVFKRLGIGLWSYESESENIDMRFTPVRTKAKNPKAREKAVERISTKIKLRKTGK